MRRATRGDVKTVWYWVLLIPFVAMLWPPFFNFQKPALAGIPFFYWYQFLWVILSACITGAVYLLAHKDR
ncbi:MAG: hypothetical protein DLM53_00785 [Candidatus Eremiobacter antarcticus]|nr:DUF3311 domain-containing protein [Candidatus Eremiobacteraeota bacterium]MBC5809066.1 DUF3311 domain-containing protein [Candidatus Eremiobacteraeota bacterium]PZR64294.1 MAG: hypothetical protein DLM53_00785 [Candidatus Eremiobacter sp. RRmetagenome_bin22]